MNGNIKLVVHGSLLQIGHRDAVEVAQVAKDGRLVREVATLREGLKVEHMRPAEIRPNLVV